MEPTRRKLGLILGAAVVAPLLAPAKAAAGLFGRRHRRRASCQPGPLQTPVALRADLKMLGIPLCTTRAGSFLFNGGPLVPFRITTPPTTVKITINPAPGSSFNHNVVDIQDLDIFGRLTNIVWTKVSTTYSGNQIVIAAYPTNPSGVMPAGTSSLTITIHAYPENANCPPNKFEASYTP